MITKYFILAVFLKQLVWGFIIPLWHFPDEQAHFAQVQNLAEKRTGEQIAEGSTSKEILASEEILQVKRDDKGNNSYTFRPNFNLEYSNNTLGLKENEIRNQPFEFRAEGGIFEATSYPPLYYKIGSYFYRAFYFQSLIERVFIVRFFSMLLSTLMAFFAFKIGLLVFKSNYKAIALGILTSFQPMVSFVGSGVSSDVLFNLLYTVFTYYLLKIFLNKKPPAKDWLALGLTVLANLLTKQQAVIAIFTTIIVLAPHVYRSLKKIKLRSVGITLLALVSLGWLGIRFGETRRVLGFLRPLGELADISILSHLSWTIKHTVAEVLPWYWGVFKWLGVVLPSFVRKVQMRLLILAVIPVLVSFYKLFKKQSSRHTQLTWFFLLISGIYFLGLTAFDYLFRLTHNFSFGIQGRYYFPTIVAHMSLILIGVEMLGDKLKKFFWIILPAWWLFLHSIGLFVVSQSYYNLSNLNQFILQVSQYKPTLIKGWPIIVLLTSLIISQFALLISYLKNVKK